VVIWAVGATTLIFFVQKAVTHLATSPGKSNRSYIISTKYFYKATFQIIRGSASPVIGFGVLFLIEELNKSYTLRYTTVVADIFLARAILLPDFVTK
jgi:hypothetical protein